jgi:hypothetical protein
MWENKIKIVASKLYQKFYRIGCLWINNAMRNLAYFIDTMEKWWVTKAKTGTSRHPYPITASLFNYVLDPGRSTVVGKVEAESKMGSLDQS